MKTRNWRKYAYEFLSIFVAVTSAFALNNWNDNRRDREAEDKIIQEIINGLQKDLDDIHINLMGHQDGIAACRYWRRYINGEEIGKDSLEQHYFDLTRDFISIQNTSGYETLKSRGLELIKNDSLRYDIISLYEYDYKTLLKFEEEYQEMQFHDTFYEEINETLAPHFVFSDEGRIVDIEDASKLSDIDKKFFKTYLWKIGGNRFFIQRYYNEVEAKVEKLSADLQKELE